MKGAVEVMVVRREGLFEPADIVFDELLGEFGNRFWRVVAITHAPPGVGVDHDVDVGADAVADEANGFEVGLGAHAGAHFVSFEAEADDFGGFIGVGLRRHVHACGAVETDLVADAAAEEF